MAGQTIQTNIAINAIVGNSFSKAGAMLTEFGTLVNGVSRELIDFGKDSVNVYRDYEQSMTDAEVALSTTYGRGTTQLSSVMTQLDTAATEWAATTIFHTNDVGNAISEAAHAGWDLDQIMTGIPAAMKLAQAGGIDLSEAVNYIVKASNSAGIEFEDMGHFIDIWAYAANSSATNIDEMGQAMLRMASTMRFASNPEELMTLIAVTANAGSVGSEAGTMIRNSMLRLIGPTDKARAAFKELGATEEEYAEISGDAELQAANARLAAQGFSPYDESGNLKSMLDIYRELYVALGAIAGGYENIEDNEDALKILTTIFPTRNTTEALNLLRAVQNGSIDLYESLMSGEAEGYGDYAAVTMMDTLGGKIETFNSKLERLKQLTGEELSGPLENLLGTLGGIVDGVAGLDEGAFSALVGGLTGIAIAGPGLFIAGGALRFVGAFVANPALVGGALAVAALAAGLGALQGYSDVEFKANFGQLELDLSALKQNVDNLTTEAETQYTQLEGYTTEISKLSGIYKTAMEAFSTELSTDVLTGKVLTPDDVKTLMGYGGSMFDAVVAGIQQRKQSSLTFLNMLLGDEEEEAGDYETYSNLYDSENSYFGGLMDEARSLGSQIQAKIAEGLADDSVLDEAEQSVINDLTDRLSEIEAEVARQTEKADFYSMLQKAGRVSYDSMDEYMDYLAQNHKERVDKLNDLYDQEEGYARSAYEYEHGEVSDEYWQSTDEYQMMERERGQALQAVDEQTGELANTAIKSLLGNSDLADTYAFLERVASEAEKDANGNIDFESIDWQKYIAEGLPENFEEDLRQLMEGTSILPWSEKELASLVSEWDGLTPEVSNFVDFLNHVAPEIGADYFNDAGTQPREAATTTINPHIESQDPVTELRSQGIDVQIDGDAQQLEATMTGFQGTEIMTYIDGDATNLEAAITSQDGKTITIYGNADDVGNQIAKYEGKTITVTIKGNNMLNVPGAGGKKGYAEGGRATEASIFGEAGAEWAIPEEHSENTAQLLNAARAASGFTWPELIARNGGLNASASGASRTLVYAPTIYAQNADGVEEVLRRNKDEMDRWYREREMRDQMEVYA